MEDFNEDKNDCINKRSTLSVVEEKVFEMISEDENPYTASDFSKLSPETNSPLAFECGGSEFNCNMNLHHDHLLAQLSLSSSSNVCMNMKDVAISTGKEVSSTIHDCPLETVSDNTAEELVMEWRLGVDDFPFVLSECADSSYDSSLSEWSSLMSSPCTSFTVNSDILSEDLDRVDIWVSSLDLDEEDSCLLQEKEQDLGFLSSDFPSPSFSAVRSLQCCPSSLSPAASHRKEANDSDEPIFWPFERTSYYSPEFDKFLSVSPRRSTMDIGFTEIHQLNPIVQRLHKNKLSSARKSIGLHNGSVSLGAKGTKLSQDKVQKAGVVPSRLSRTTNASSKQHPPSNCEKRKPSHLKISPPRKDRYPQLQSGYTVQELEASDLQNLTAKKILIEQFIGLDEFDGHEGISSDSSNNQFSLCLSPR
ncbi:hypothetical protein ABZP36_034997 [Zizania latifolia]